MNNEDIKAVENKDFSATCDFKELLDIVRDVLMDIGGAANESELHSALSYLEVWGNKLKDTTPKRDTAILKERKRILVESSDFYLLN